MPFPTPGSHNSTGTGVFQVRNLQFVIEHFNTSVRPGTTRLYQNRHTMIAWMSLATQIATNNAGNVSTLEIPANPAQGRPQIILFGDFSNSADRDRAELIDEFLSSNDPDIRAILEPFTQTVQVGPGGAVTVAPQAVFIALANFNLSVPGQGQIQGMGDYNSNTDGEFEVVLNTGQPISSNFEKAQFLYYLVHELDHRNGFHASLSLDLRRTPIRNVQDFSSFFGNWSPNAILGSGSAIGFRRSDPHYARSFQQWERALSVLHINLSDPEHDAIVNNNDLRYNRDVLHDMRQSMFEVFADQLTKYNTPDYFLSNNITVNGRTTTILQLMINYGAIRRKKGVSSTSTRPTDYEQVRSVAERQAEARCRRRPSHHRARCRADGPAGSAACILPAAECARCRDRPEARPYRQYDDRRARQSGSRGRALGGPRRLPGRHSGRCLSHVA